MNFTSNIKDSPEASGEVAHARSKDGIGEVVGTARDEFAFKVPAVDTTGLSIS